MLLLSNHIIAILLNISIWDVLGFIFVALIMTALFGALCLLVKVIYKALFR